MDENSSNVPAVEALAKTAATFRLTPKAHRLIALAVNNARAEGHLATKGAMVEQAVRAAYGHLDTAGTTDTPGVGTADSQAAPLEDEGDIS